jgi:3-hydroxyethyl bacteriochlorophyllide a dehydrogenase
MAVVLEQPSTGRASWTCPPPLTADVVVDIAWSGISTGTEKLLWSGRMPPFPGHGLSAGAGLRIGRPGAQAGPASVTGWGERVFVPGAAASARCAACSAVPRAAWWCRGARALPSTKAWATRRAAGAGRHGYHAVSGGGPARRIAAARPDRRPRRAGPPAGAAQRAGRVPGHRGLGNEPARPGRQGYPCCTPTTTAARLPRHLRRQRRRRILDTPDQPPGTGRRDRAGRLLQPSRCRSRFPPAFMREAQIRVPPPNGSAPTCWPSRHWRRSGCAVARRLITHHGARHSDADRAYRTAFGDPACLKMVLDWRHAA